LADCQDRRFRLGRWSGTTGHANLSISAFKAATPSSVVRNASLSLLQNERDHPRCEKQLREIFRRAVGRCREIAVETPRMKAPRGAARWRRRPLLVGEAVATMVQPCSMRSSPL